MLNAFAVMGSAYVEKVLGRKDPSVGLVNNGTEETKGTPDYVAAHALLKQNKTIRFVGNVEPKTIPEGSVDVIDPLVFLHERRALAAEAVLR